MKVGFFSAKQYDINHFNRINQTFGLQIEYFDYRLCLRTVRLAHGFEAICAFVNDSLCEEVLIELSKNGTKVIAMRCNGFNNVDLEAAKKLNLKVVNVPSYSPESVAEHTVALMLTLNRKVHKAYQRTRDANFSLTGLVGFNMQNRNVGVIGTGRIGLATIKILLGFGCHVFAHDPYPNHAVLDLGVEYVSLEEIFATCDIISLHCPLTSENHHLLNKESFSRMKPGVMVINTSRGGLLNALDAIEALKTGQLGSLLQNLLCNNFHLFY